MFANRSHVRYEFTNTKKVGKKLAKIETRGAYHLVRKCGNFGLKSNGKVIFRKFCSEIVEYLQRYSSFSVRDEQWKFAYHLLKVSSFQSLISRKQLREIEVQMVSAILFGLFADFGKTLTIIQRSSQPFILTNGKHPYLSPTVCHRVCRLFLWRSHTPTWVCQHESGTRVCKL